MPHSDARSILAAGLILLAEHQGQMLVLLGRDRWRRRYSVLAGKRQRLRDATGQRRLESPYQTAIREAAEESRGYWQQAQLTALCSADRFIDYGRCRLFTATVGYVPAAAIKAKALPSLSPRFAAYREIAAFAWVAVEAVLQCPPQRVPSIDGRTIRVHRALAHELQQLCSQVGTEAATATTIETTIETAVKTAVDNSCE